MGNYFLFALYNDPNGGITPEFKDINDPKNYHHRLYYDINGYRKKVVISKTELSSFSDTMTYVPSAGDKLYAYWKSEKYGIWFRSHWHMLEKVFGLSKVYDGNVLKGVFKFRNHGQVPLLTFEGPLEEEEEEDDTLY